MSPVRWIAFGAAALALPAACGFPTFSYAPSTGGSSAGGATTTSSESSSSSSTDTGGMGGAGPKPCHPLKDAVDCGPGERCTVVDKYMGTFGCVPLSATPKAPYQRCTNDSECTAGTICDYRTSVCDPFCDGIATCPSQRCVAASFNKGDNTELPIPGVTVCVAHCDPLKANACGAGATCAYDPSFFDFDCFFHTGKQPGQACQYINDCPPQYVCASTCSRWCHPAGSTGVECGGGSCLEFQNATFVYDGVEYGFCP